MCHSRLFLSIYEVVVKLTRPSVEAIVHLKRLTIGYELYNRHAQIHANLAMPGVANTEGSHT